MVLVQVPPKFESGCRELATATGQGFCRRDLVGECQGVSACSVGASGARALIPRSAWVRVSAVRYSWFPPGGCDGKALGRPRHRSFFGQKSGRTAPFLLPHRAPYFQRLHFEGCGQNLDRVFGAELPHFSKLSLSCAERSQITRIETTHGRLI